MERIDDTSEKSTIPHRNRSPYDWWIASYVERACWDDEPLDDDSVIGRVWENTIILQADDREAAYDKAMRLASESEAKFDDGEIDARIGHWRFVGLSSLLAIHEELTDGAEVIWVDHGAMSFRETKRRVCEKHELEAFDDTPVPEDDGASPNDEETGIVRFWRDAGPVMTQ